MHTWHIWQFPLKYIFTDYKIISVLDHFGFVAIYFYLWFIIIICFSLSLIFCLKHSIPQNQFTTLWNNFKCLETKKKKNSKIAYKTNKKLCFPHFAFYKILTPFETSFHRSLNIFFLHYYKCKGNENSIQQKKHTTEKGISKLTHSIYAKYDQYGSGNKTQRNYTSNEGSISASFLIFQRGMYHMIYLLNLKPTNVISLWVLSFCNLHKYVVFCQDTCSCFHISFFNSHEELKAERTSQLFEEWVFFRT